MTKYTDDFYNDILDLHEGMFWIDKENCISNMIYSSFCNH